MNNTKESVILAGDFNAPHNQWGYKKTLRRGRLIASLSKKLNLELLNNVNTPTRFGASAQQDDRTRWSVYMETMGSDHVPLCTALYIGCSPRKEIRFIIWDTFREALSTLNNTDLALRIQEAMRKAQSTYQVKEESPYMDLHLLSLWASRLQALQQYRKIKRSQRLKIKLNLATAKAKRYTLELDRSTWQIHCNSFNERTGLKKVWRTCKGMAGKTKNKNTGSNLAWHLHISEDELAALAAETFFPQPSTPSPSDCYQIQTENAHLPEDSLFTMGELVFALNTAKCNTAPGPDCITLNSIRNLPEVDMQDLVNWFNDVWQTGLLPNDWKLSTVISIPKQGKSLTNINNLRPISVTSNLCKVIERMVLTRITWSLETSQQIASYANRISP
ncbi:hypothetical protein HPB47_002648 [Ixodes persulcatus]|uniref:Uncharacterized protein n=1 Tax=Ixodes persulcatus TaxID=34615 RepID=A0AC60PKT7_IXOPE|nr:hypothetical protein HPB47_002648 [Ixodes persulcatus]